MTDSILVYEEHAICELIGCQEGRNSIQVERQQFGCSANEERETGKHIDHCIVGDALQLCFQRLQTPTEVYQ